MRLSTYCISDVGCVRNGNEDMVSIGIQLVRDSVSELSYDSRNGRNFALLVADGMGGHERGEEASRYTLEELRRLLYDSSTDWSNPTATLVGAVKSISTALNSKSVESGMQMPMGSTLCGLIFVNGSIWSINVGDSRMYRLRDGILRQLSVDQTLHERDGVPLPEGKRIYSCIGGGIMPEVSMENLDGRMFDGDRLLICSDGLSDMVDYKDIERLLKQANSPADAATNLVHSAKLAGGADNVSVIVVFVEESEAAGFAAAEIQENEGVSDKGNDEVPFGEEETGEQTKMEANGENSENG